MGAGRAGGGAWAGRDGKGRGPPDGKGATGMEKDPGRGGPLGS